MKSQNKNNKLAFNTTAVMELNNNQMNNINGGIVGSTIVGGGDTCTGCVCLPVLTKMTIIKGR